MIIYFLVLLSILGYVFFKKWKGLRETGLTGKILARTFTLSLNNPFDEIRTIELIAINDDGSATIRTLRSDEKLTAKPSEYFVGEDFGSFGLCLMSISQDRDEIQLKHSVQEYLR